MSLLFGYDQMIRLELRVLIALGMSSASNALKRLIRIMSEKFPCVQPN